MGELDFCVCEDGAIVSSLNGNGSCGRVSIFCASSSPSHLLQEGGKKKSKKTSRVSGVLVVGLGKGVWADKKKCIKSDPRPPTGNDIDVRDV